MHRDVARTKDGTPFIEWKPDHIQLAGGLFHRDSPEARNFMDAFRRAPPPRQTANIVSPDEALARELLGMAVRHAAKEFGCLAMDIRQPSQIPEIKRARARAASLLLCHLTHDGQRQFTAEQVAKMMRFSDPVKMVELVTSAKLPT